MPKTTQRNVEPSQELFSSTGKAKALAGSGVCTHINGLIASSVSSGTYYLQIWDGDPDSGGTLKWWLPVEKPDSTASEFGSDALPDVGVYCYDSVWVALSDSVDDYTGSVTGNFAVNCQRD